MAILDMTENDTVIDQRELDKRRLSELTGQYLRGEIEMDYFQKEIDQLDIQIDFRRFANRYSPGLADRIATSFGKLLALRQSEQ
jgi:hypothetical protein